MFRKLALCCSAVALVGSALFVSGSGAVSAPPIDASHYTIRCDTLNKGIVGFKPALAIPGGANPTLTKFTGLLSGCTATPDGSNPPITVISGAVTGLINGTNNSCLSLLGPSTASGTITIKWKTVEKLASAVTTITVGSGNLSGGQIQPYGTATGDPTYGAFNISGTTQTGAFGGPSGTGAASTSKSMTVEDVGNLAGQCTSVKGLKLVNLGPTSIALG